MRLDGFGPVLGSLVDRRGTDLTSQRDNAFGSLLSSYQAPQVPEPPKRRKAVTSRDLLPLLLLGAVAKLTGVAKDRDLAEFGRGFVGGRQQWAQGENEDAMQRYQDAVARAGQQNVTAQNIAKLKYGRAEDDLSAFQSAQNARAKQRYDEQQSALDRGSREGIAKMTQEGLTQRNSNSTTTSMLKAYLSKASPEARAEIAASAGADPNVVEALRQLSVEETLKQAQTGNVAAQTGLTVAKTDTERKMLPGKLALQKLNIDNFQEITKAKLALAAAHTSQAYEMINRYQEMTAQGWAGLDVAQQKIAAGSYSGAVKEWNEAQSSLRTSMDAAHKEAESARKELSAATLMRGLSENDQQRAAYDAQIAGLNERIQAAQEAHGAAAAELTSLKAAKPSPPPGRASGGTIGRKAPARTRDIDTSGELGGGYVPPRLNIEGTGLAIGKLDPSAKLPAKAPSKPPAKKNKVKWG